MKTVQTNDTAPLAGKTRYHFDAEQGLGLKAIHVTIQNAYRAEKLTLYQTPVGRLYIQAADLARHFGIDQRVFRRKMAQIVPAVSRERMDLIFRSRVRRNRWMIDLFGLHILAEAFPAASKLFLRAFDNNIMPMVIKNGELINEGCTYDILLDNAVNAANILRKLSLKSVAEGWRKTSC